MIDLTKHDREILQAILDGKELELSHDGNIWYPIYNFSGYINSVNEEHEIRIKPNTILVNDVRVEEPMRVEPAIGDHYYVASPKWGERTVWANDAFDSIYFSAGVCHTNSENARKHWEAMIKPTKNH